MCVLLGRSCIPELIRYPILKGSVSACVRVKQPQVRYCIPVLVPLGTCTCMYAHTLQRIDIVSCIVEPAM